MGLWWCHPFFFFFFKISICKCRALSGYSPFFPNWYCQLKEVLKTFNTVCWSFFLLLNKHKLTWWHLANWTKMETAKHHICFYMSELLFVQSSFFFNLCLCCSVWHDITTFVLLNPCQWVLNDAGFLPALFNCTAFQVWHRSDPLVDWYTEQQFTNKACDSNPPFWAFRYGWSRITVFPKVNSPG